MPPSTRETMNLNVVNSPVLNIWLKRLGLNHPRDTLIKASRAGHTVNTIQAIILFYYSYRITVNYRLDGDCVVSGPGVSTNVYPWTAAALHNRLINRDMLLWDPSQGWPSISQQWLELPLPQQQPCSAGSGGSVPPSSEAHTSAAAT